MSVDKPSLVLLPGFLCDDAVWQQQIDSLSDAANCMCLDWGDLDSIAGMAEKVLAVAPPKFALAGHSMGGRVAFQVYRMAPERVERIALLNTGADGRPAGEKGEEEERKRRSLLRIAQEQGMRAGAMAWYPPMIDARRVSDMALVEPMVAMVERKTPEIWEKQLMALLGRPDARPVLDMIRCPALFLSGHQDTWSPPARHAEMSAKIPGSKLAIVNDSGHMSTMEQPAAVSQALREWLLS
jgi:pimeloyl-ACP methyl ester carboxylesterase